MASIAFPAWCLGHNPSAQILCVSYAQDLADKLARDCRGVMLTPWYLNSLFHLRRDHVTAAEHRASRTRTFQVWAEICSMGCQ